MLAPVMEESLHTTQNGNLCPNVTNVVRLKVEDLTVVTPVVLHIGLMEKFITPVA